MDIKQYIIDSARRHGIDPNIALRVAASEGGFGDPTQQSNVVRGGRREPSYGPFQLLVGGEGTGFPVGLGNRALAAGIDPRDPNNVYKGIDFALKTAANEGWGQWYGAAKAGIGKREGIHGLTLNTSSPITVASGAPAPELPAPTTVTDKPIAGVADTTAPPTTPMGVLEALTKEGEGGTLSPLAKLAATATGKAPEPLNIDPAHALASSEAADASRMQAGQSLMAQLLGARRKRVPGLSLMG